MAHYQQATVIYDGPSGTSWQIQGEGQEGHPVTLMPKPYGLYGAPLNVKRQTFAGRRGSRRTSTLAKSPEVELQVRIDGAVGKDIEAKIAEFLSEWPEDGRTGTLQVHTHTHGWRSLEVYRTEAIEPLHTRDPMVSGRAKFLIVASADDPYPVMPYEPVIVKVPHFGEAFYADVHNPGEVTIYPQIKWNGGAAELVGGWRDPVDGVQQAWHAQVTGDALIDLDPHRLTVTDAAGTRGMQLTWQDAGDIPIPPGETVELAFWSLTPGSFEIHAVPRLTRLYA